MKFEGEIITSRQNRTVVEVGKLTDRRARETAESFRFDGVKLLLEALKNGVIPQLILVKESCENTLAERFSAYAADLQKTRILRLSDGVFDKISEEKSPEGVISVAKYLDKLQKNVTIYSSEEFLPRTEERIVLLESVRDPANVGAIIRSAAALGVDRLIMSADCADIYNSKAVRASMGAVFNQRIHRVGSMKEAIAALQKSGRRVYAAALDERAMQLGSFRAEAGACVVIGNEGHGLSEEVLRACDCTVFIPMSGRTESFNAAVAASILMWEFGRA